VPVSIESEAALKGKGNKNESSSDLKPEDI